MPYVPYDLPKVELRGTPFEIGQRYGQLTRTRVNLHLLNQKTAMARLEPQKPEWWREEVRRTGPP